MISLLLRTKPAVLFCYTPNFVEIVIRVENRSKDVKWAEADVSVPESLSLYPNGELQKGRVRIGILGRGEYIEKAVRVYANKYTNPQVYKCKVTLFIYDKEGIIEKRIEKTVDVLCEGKGPQTL